MFPFDNILFLGKNVFSHDILFPRDKFLFNRDNIVLLPDKTILLSRDDILWPQLTVVPGIPCSLN